LLENPVQDGQEESRYERGCGQAEVGDFLPRGADRQREGAETKAEAQKPRRAVEKHAEAGRRNAPEKSLVRKMGKGQVHNFGNTSFCARISPSVMKSNR